MIMLLLVIIVALLMCVVGALYSISDALHWQNRWLMTRRNDGTKDADWWKEES